MKSESLAGLLHMKPLLASVTQRPPWSAPQLGPGHRQGTGRPAGWGVSVEVIPGRRRYHSTQQCRAGEGELSLGETLGCSLCSPPSGIPRDLGTCLSSPLTHPQTTQDPSLASREAWCPFLCPRLLAFSTAGYAGPHAAWTAGGGGKESSSLLLGAVWTRSLGLWTLMCWGGPGALKCLKFPADSGQSSRSVTLGPVKCCSGGLNSRVV